VPETYLRAIPLEQRHSIHHDGRYWQALRCGWDAFDDALRRDPVLACAPDESAFWLWWAASLHPKQRAELERLSKLCSEHAEAAAPDAEPDDLVQFLFAKFPDDQGRGMAILTAIEGGMN
jgi:hypothetical protein